MFGDLRQNSYYLGNLAGIPIFIHFSVVFLVLMVWGSAGGVDASLPGVVLLLVALILAVLLHELGHGLTAKAMGAFGLTITLWAMGGLCSSTRDTNQRFRELCILAAGPLVSLVLWLGAALVFNLLNEYRPEVLTGHLGVFLFIFSKLNLLLLLFNILPIFPLDGGQMVYNGMLMCTRNHLLVRQICLTVSVVGAVAYFCYSTGLFGYLGSPDPMGAWMQTMRNQGYSVLWLIILLGLLLRNAFMYLR